MPQHAIVTGGAGFLGSHLIDALIAKKWEVTVIDDLSTGFRKNVHPKATFKRMDIRKPATAALVRRLKPQAIFHLAAQASVSVSVRHPLKDAEANINATLRLLEAAAEVKIKRFVFTGTGGALSSEHVKLPTAENDIAIPASPYAIAKRTAELYGAFFCATRNLPFIAYRPANIYGPRQNPHGEAGVIAIFCKRMLAGEPVRINGTGKQTRDYVYVEDVVSALLTALSHPHLEGPLHVGTGKETSVNELFHLIAARTGYMRKAQHGPADIGAPLRSALNATALKRVTKWAPKTSLPKGLDQTVAWFREQQ